MTMKQLVFPSLFTSFPQLKSLLATKFYYTSSQHFQGGLFSYGNTRLACPSAEMPVRSFGSTFGASKDFSPASFAGKAE